MKHRSASPSARQDNSRSVHWIFKIQDEIEKATGKKTQDSQSVVDSLDWQLEQMKRRERGDVFGVEEHIRGMVYSMLSSQRDWQIVARLIGDKKPRDTLSEIFEDYNPAALERKNARGLEKMTRQLEAVHCGFVSDRRKRSPVSGAKAVVENIKAIRSNMDRIDRLSDIADPKERYDAACALVEELGKGSGKPFHLMREALVAQYLRNVGIDIPKSDTHLKRFLGSARMGRKDNHAVATVREVFNEVWDIHVQTRLRPAEIDHLIWLYCARGGLTRCAQKPNCTQCPLCSCCRRDNPS